MGSNLPSVAALTITPSSDQNWLHNFFLSNSHAPTLYLELHAEEITGLGHAVLFDYEPRLTTWVDKEYKLTS